MVATENPKQIILVEGSSGEIYESIHIEDAPINEGGGTDKIILPQE